MLMKDLSGYLSQDKIMQILNEAKKENERDYLLLLTLAVTGRRVSEIVGLHEKKMKTKTKRIRPPIGGLKPEDILFDRDAAVFTILKKKKRIRKVKPIPNFLKKLLVNYIYTRKIKRGERIFPITRQRVDQIVKKYAEKAGIYKVGERKMHAHVFRHSYAVHLIDKINIKMLKELLDHSSLDVTSEYLQYSTRDIEKTINKMFSSE